MTIEKPRHPGNPPEAPLLRLDAVWFQVTGTLCNLQCTHCFIACGPQVDRHQMMTRDQIRLYLDEARDLGVKEIYFTGGEPFLHRKMEDILDDALAVGPTTVLTNGTLLTDTRIARLREVRERHPDHALTIRVSLDSFEERANDRIRGGGSFRLALAALKRLTAAGFHPIVTCANLPDAGGEARLKEGFARLAEAEDLGAFQLKILPPLLIGAEATRSRPYGHNEWVTQSCLTDYNIENLQCTTSRMVTAAGVHVCPILIDEPGSLMAQTLRESMRPFPLAYQACWTCRTTDFSCANENVTEVKTMSGTNGNGCGCGPAGGAVAEEPASEPRAAVTRDEVRAYYAKAAETPQPELCCPTAYAPEDVAHIPKAALEVSYGCGSPLALAAPAVGETVLDLGSGGGIDCFIAAKRVGASGRVIGVDMTAPMLARAQESAHEVGKALGYANVEFRQGVLEDVPVRDGVADLVTSNCVVNLSTDKPRVFGEIARVLKSGGRFVISDIVSETTVPETMRADREKWGECLAGAVTEAEFMTLAREAGFYGLEILKCVPYKTVENVRFLSVTVRGWRFVKGPTCVYIGQYATYRGPFRQASDDDDHTYPRGVPVEVCTDTATKLQAPPYAGQFLVTDPTRPIEEAKSCVSAGVNGGCC